MLRHRGQLPVELELQVTMVIDGLAVGGAERFDPPCHAMPIPGLTAMPITRRRIACAELVAERTKRREVDEALALGVAKALVRVAARRAASAMARRERAVQVAQDGVLLSHDRAVVDAICRAEI